MGTPGHCAGDAAMNKKEMEEILNSIIPPREWRDDSGNLWRQTVRLFSPSSSPNHV